MKKYKKRLILFFFAIMACLKLGCIDTPKDLALPTWNVDLNVPITNRGYTLWDAIKKDTSKISYYKTSGNYGLLYYSDTRRIAPVTVGNNLNIGSFSYSPTVQIGSIQISTPASVNTTISPVDISSSIPYNTPVIFPPIATQTVSKSFSQEQQFRSVILSSGTLDLTIVNNFPTPVQMVISKISIRNLDDNSIIFSDNNIYAINSGATKALSYNVAGKRISDYVIADVTISSPGSGTSLVTLNSSTNLAFTLQLKNYSFSQVIANISSNTFNISNTVKFDDSTFVQSAVINSGTINITASSYIDLDLTATLSIPALKNVSGTAYSQVISLTRGQKNKVITPLSLAGYTLADPSGNLVNNFQYTVSVTSSATSDLRTINSTDYVTANVGISNLNFRSFTGQIKPTILTVKSTTINLDMGDITNKLLVGQVDIENPSIILKLNKSASLGFSFYGTLTGQNGTQTSQLTIPNTTLSSSQTTITLSSSDVRTFIKSFSGKLPTSVVVNGKGIVNPAYAVGSVSSTDSIFGSAYIEFPMKVSIVGGSIRDSSSVDISNDDRDKMDKVAGGSLVLEIQNGIAMEAQFSSRLYDASHHFLMNLPPTPNDTLVAIHGASVNSSGDVTSSTSSTITFTLTKEQVTKLRQGSYMISKIQFYTTGASGTTVKFKTSDPFTIKAYGTLTYTVKE